jgi:hypothetical protein
MSTAVVLNRNFRLLDADDSRASALAVVIASRAAYLIVRRTIRAGADPRYYVFSREDAYAKLEQPGWDTAGASLRLHTVEPKAVVQLDSAQRSGSKRQVVLDGSTPVGLLKARHRGGSVSSLSRVPTPENAARASGNAATGAVQRELNASWPGSVDAGSTVALLISLASLGIRAGSSLPFVLTPGVTIDVVVRPLDGMTLAGTNTGTLVVREPQPDEPLMFRLTAGQRGRGAVRIYAYSSGYSVASFGLTTMITAQGETPAQPEAVQTSASVPTSPRARPDLSIFVTEAGSEIRFRLQSVDQRLGEKNYPAVPVSGSSREYFSQFSRDIENMAVDKPAERQTTKRTLELLGTGIFERLLPAELKKDLWNLRGRIGTMQITSDEAWIPWEVCRLMGRDANGANTEGEFFGEAFCVTRWLHGAAAPLRFRFGQWALVVPKDSRLPLASREERFIRSLHTAQRQVTSIVPRFAELTAAMESEKYDAWHFCGHAHAGQSTDADKSAIELENRESITADLFVGRVENALRTGPFVFFNACQSAQGGLSLTGVGGWARRFIKPTFERYAASAFIGSYWSVYDEAAHHFAVELYQGLFEGRPIGQAVKDARRAVRSKNEDPLTWLAYTVYADPLATAERSDHATS